MRSGYSALYDNTSGGNNTASGSFALYSNTIGADNFLLWRQKEMTKRRSKGRSMSQLERIAQ